MPENGNITKKESLEPRPRIPVTNSITKSLHAWAPVVARVCKKTQEEGTNPINLIITPNHDWTDTFVADLTSEEIVKKSEVAYISNNYADLQLERLGMEKDLIRSMTCTQLLKEHDSRFGHNIMMNKPMYIVSDVFRRWEVQRSDDSPKNHYHLIIWLLGFERISVEKLQEMFDRIGELANVEYATTEIISMSSVETAREVDFLRFNAEEQGGWSINVLLDNLPTYSLTIGGCQTTLHLL